MTEISPRATYLENQLCIGVVNYLEQRKGICKVKLDEKKPTERHTVLSWEQRNSCFLPEDMKNFYMSTNGFDLSWSVEIDGNKVPVGRMHIHPINQVHKLSSSFSSNTNQLQPSLLDLETESDDEEIHGREKPKFHGSNGIFELDDCGGFGKVCLVVKKKTGITDTKVDIWFLDRSIQWHFIADSFSSYFRLMLMHLGLPQWQYAFTDIGLSLQAKQWFNMYAPIRLEVDIEGHFEVESPRDKEKKSDIQLDINRVFKGKSDKKKPPTQTNQPIQGKKKQPVSSARSQSSLAGKSTSSSSQSSIKAGR